MLRHIDIGNAGTELPRWARTRGHRLQLDRIRTVDCGSQGMVIKFGRYISPPDIEAQLAPDNYLYTHSLMFTFDCYTQTGINAAIKLNDQWSILFGIHAGDDIAPWNGCSSPNSDGHGSVGIKEQQRLPMGWHRFLERRQVQGWTR